MAVERVSFQRLIFWRRIAIPGQVKRAEKIGAGCTPNETLIYPSREGKGKPGSRDENACHDRLMNLVACRNPVLYRLTEKTAISEMMD
jgi:hypothetical protein